MKKFICTLLMLTSMMVTGCSGKIVEEKASPKEAERLLLHAGFEVKMLNEEKAKSTIEGLDFGSLKVEQGISAFKTGDEKITDFIIVFYFSKGDEAEEFINMNDNANAGILDKFAENIVGVDNKMIGIYNNAVYTGSVTSYITAGLTIG